MIVTHSELSDLKAWILQQFGDLCSKINEDMLKILGDKSQHSKLGYPHSDKSKSHAMNKKDKLVSRKRQREELTSLSSGNSSSILKHGLYGQIPIGRDAKVTPNFVGFDDTWDLYGLAKYIAQV